MLGFIDNLVPSWVSSVEILQRNLKWSSRIAYLYNFCLSFLVLYFTRGINQGDDLFFGHIFWSYLFIFLICLQAAFFFYSFQSYRRLFRISVKLSDKKLLQVVFAFWLILLFLFNFWQMTFGQFIPFLPSIGFQLDSYIAIISLVSIFFGVTGELLLRRIGL